MQRNHTRGILAIVIVVLFIGVGIQPAFAVNTKQSMVNIVSFEDCGCGEVSDTDLVKVDRLLDRVEVYNKLLLVLYKYTPEIKDEIEDLSIKISILKEELADEAPLQTICVILEIIHEILKVLYWFFLELSYELMLFYLPYALAYLCSVTVRIIKFHIFFIGYLLSCWEWPGPPTGTLIVKILDTQGGSPQSGVTIEIINGTHGVLTKTFSNGKAYFFFTPYKDYEVRVNFIFAGTVEFYQPKLEVKYYLDELTRSMLEYEINI